MQLRRFDIFTDHESTNAPQPRVRFTTRRFDMRLLALIGVAFVLLVLVSIFGERKPPSDPGEEQRFQTVVATAATLRSRMRNPGRC
jgi:hypothetical protein